MKSVFADTFYFLALLNPRDVANARAANFTTGFSSLIVSTTWVLTEVADAMARPDSRTIAGVFIEGLVQQRAVQIVPTSDALFSEGLALYNSHRDKAWSLTDCISFVVTQREGITDALTGDHHFAQAGFAVLLQ